jgi:hypothetical protein
MNSTSANYKAITKTQIQHKNSIHTKTKQNAKWPKQEQYDRQKQYTGHAGTKTLNSAKRRYVDLKMPKINAVYVLMK